MGYKPEGRTLKVLETEARAIRRLYDLYCELGTVRAVRDEAERLRLRTRVRTAPDGRVSGGTIFDRGHIHHILTNPVYAGRIRHRTKVYDGQHDAIIDPGLWEEVQRRLTDKAARPRSRRDGIDRRHAVTSPLAGKLFDETGDRLTPSHSKTSSGKRLRYYVSGRLIRKSGKDHRSGWRLPAHDLEELIAGKIGELQANPSWAALACAEGDLDPLDTMTSRQIAEKAELPALFNLVDRVDVAPGRIDIRLSAKRLGSWMCTSIDATDPETLILRAPFRQRRRGVEQKLIVDNPAARPDDPLIRNVALAHGWFADLRAGSSCGDIARRTGTSKRRIMQVVDLAFLAPDLTAEILDGLQPASLTSDLLIKQGIPSDWGDQRRLFDSLR